MGFEKSMVSYNQIDDMNFYRYDPEINQGTIIQDGEVWGTYSFGSRDFIVVDKISLSDETPWVLDKIVDDVLRKVGVVSISGHKDIVDHIQSKKSMEKEYIDKPKERFRIKLHKRYFVRVEDTFLNIGKRYES